MGELLQDFLPGCGVALTAQNLGDSLVWRCN